MLDPAIPAPASGRTFSARRSVRLADADPRGRVRLDALVRFCQDVAIDDVQETGWGTPEHLWFVRRIRIDVLEPFAGDTTVELVTWCSSVATIAAGRRWSLTGDAGGRAEVDSVWIHLGPDARPARIVDFVGYSEAAGGRPASTKLELPAPPVETRGVTWPLRTADIDRHGHVNNAVYWQAVEHVLPGHGVDLARPLSAELDYREPIDLGDSLELVAVAASSLLVGFCVGDVTAAVARVTAR